MNLKIQRKFQQSKFYYKNRELLESNYQQYLLSQERKAISRILPYTNKYLIALYKRGLFPSFMRKCDYATRLNALQCESHRDILQNVLHKKLTNNEF